VQQPHLHGRIATLAAGKRRLVFSGARPYIGAKCDSLEKPREEAAAPSMHLHNE
jgi:hypothetical protein